MMRQRAGCAPVITASYHRAMFEVADGLQAGIMRGEERLREAQNAVVQANAGITRRSTDAAMAQTAQSAIFSEALLGALHARLDEIKSVTK
jgi:hypothetical protein